MRDISYNKKSENISLSRSKSPFNKSKSPFNKSKSPSYRNMTKKLTNFSKVEIAKYTPNVNK